MSAQWEDFYRRTNQVRTPNDEPKKFFGAKASAATLQARRQAARYESRRNQCPTCFTARPCACDC